MDLVPFPFSLSHFLWLARVENSEKQSCVGSSCFKLVKITRLSCRLCVLLGCLHVVCTVQLAQQANDKG